MKLSTFYKKHIHIVPGIKAYVLAAAFVFILGMVITMLSWYVDRERIESQKTRQLNEQVVAVQADITSRLNIYEQILRGGSGLFRASEQVTAAEWRRYVQTYEHQGTYPGVDAIGYIQYVPAASLQSYIKNIRAQNMPDFTVSPKGTRSEYAPVTYIEPMNDSGKKVAGFDVLTDPMRSSTVAKARDSGEVVVSKKLIFLSDRGKSNHASFNMYAATYQKNSNPKTIDARRSSLAGFTFATFRADNFFNRVINKSTFTAFSEVRIFDGATTDPQSLLFQSTGFDKYQPDELSPTFTSKVNDRTWTFQFAEPIIASNENTQSSNMILIGGTTISFAIAGFLFLIMLTRARAIVYSKQYETQQAKDDLLSLASHQLRTPATAVKQYLGMILEGYTGKVDKKQLPALQKAYASNERQLETINQILYVAKADAGRLSIHKSAFDINALVNDIALDLSDTLEANQQSVVIERMRKKQKVYADEASIRMVVENLISNASKYSREGGRITVKTGTNNNEVFVSVTDKGVGIAPEDFNKLFQKFSRIDNDLSLQVGGSGIGLYIDKVLIELHSGRIEVDSRPNVGSTFTIYLPKKSASNLTDGSKGDTAL